MTGNDILWIASHVRINTIAAIIESGTEEQKALATIACQALFGLRDTVNRTDRPEALKLRLEKIRKELDKI